jgi:small subunit ribosomal protein S17
MPRRILQGTVVSDVNDKTVVVRVERRVMHPIYKKFIRRSKKYAAHDPLNAFKVGDVVRIRECRPISKSKTWEVLTGDEAGAEGATSGVGGIGATLASGASAAASGVSAVASGVASAASGVAAAVVSGVSAVAGAVTGAVTGSGNEQQPPPPEGGA